MACQAGKDRLLREARQLQHRPKARRMVEAARKYNRRRADRDTAPEHAATSRMPSRRVHAGEIGKVGAGTGLDHPRKRESIGHGTPGARSPRAVDYDMWQGPAPDRPFMSNRFPLQLALVSGTGATGEIGK